MKIINEKGKLFGIINVVDLLVLVAAIAVVAGVGYQAVCQADQGGCVSAGLPDDDCPRTRCNAVPGKRGAAQQPGR